MASDMKPKLKAPPGACDTHMHIYDARYPLSPLWTVVPPEAPVARVTLSKAAILSTRTLLITIAGEEKKDVLERAIARGAGV